MLALFVITGKTYCCLRRAPHVNFASPSELSSSVILMEVDGVLCSTHEIEGFEIEIGRSAA
jgi:hypothetical protein